MCSTTKNAREVSSPCGPLPSSCHLGRYQSFLRTWYAKIATKCPESSITYLPGNTSKAGSNAQLLREILPLMAADSITVFSHQKFSFQIHLQEMGVRFGDMHMASICFCLQKRRTFSFPICHVQYRRTSTSSCGTSAFQMIGYKLCKEMRKVQEMANGVTVSCHLYSI